MKKVIIALCLILLCPAAAAAFEVYVVLKDGRTIKTQSARVVGESVVCIVDGRNKVLLKKDVERIIDVNALRIKSSRQINSGSKVPDEPKTICHIYFQDGRKLEKDRCSVSDAYIHYFSKSTEVKLPKHMIEQVVLVPVIDDQEEIEQEEREEQVIYSRLLSKTEHTAAENNHDNSASNAMKRMEAESLARARGKAGYGKDYSISAKIHPGMKLDDVLITLGKPDDSYTMNHSFTGARSDRSYNKVFRYKTTRIYFWNNEVSWVEEGYQ